MYHELREVKGRAWLGQSRPGLGIAGQELGKAGQGRNCTAGLGQRGARKKSTGQSIAGKGWFKPIRTAVNSKLNEIKPWLKRMRRKQQQR